MKILLDGGLSKSKRFLEYTRFKYAYTLISFLHQGCKKSFVKCNANFIYKSAKELDDYVFSLKRFHSKKYQANQRYFLNFYMMLIDIYVTRFESLEKGNPERSSIVNLVDNAILAAEVYAKLLQDEQELKKYQLLKGKALTTCNL